MGISVLHTVKSIEALAVTSRDPEINMLSVLISTGGVRQKG